MLRERKGCRQTEVPTSEGQSRMQSRHKWQNQENAVAWIPRAAGFRVRYHRLKSEQIEEAVGLGL